MASIPLYSMPPEIWLNILNYLSEPDFLALKLSSAHLRNVITDNASTICNNLIMTHYAQEASIIGTSFLDGWLVPVHPAITREEKQLSRYASRASPRARSCDVTEPPERSHAAIRTKLSEPGPQYLRFLIEYSFDIRVANSMFIEPPHPQRPAFCKNDPETPQEKFDRWIGLYTVRKFLTRLQKIAGGRMHPLLSRSYQRPGQMEQESAMLKVTRDGLAWFYT